MLTVLRVHLQSPIPVVGVEITPYVLIRRPDWSVSAEDVHEDSPVQGYFLKYKWYRIESDNKVAFCCVHPTKLANYQCEDCAKYKSPGGRTYHCSPKCFLDSWPHHRILHERAATSLKDKENEEEDLSGCSNSSGSGAASQSHSSLSNATTSSNPAAIAQKNGAETWFEVGYAKTYTPTADDIGHVLKFECVVVDAETKLPAGNAIANTVVTSSVISAPFPTPRRLISLNGVDMTGRDVDGSLSSSGPFTVLSYNILADSCATNEIYSHCPSWALSWPYRRQNLLREIVGYRADIICLQEVQNDHYEDFFVPQLDKHGYQALFKGKPIEVSSGNGNAINGCATFFRKDRFSPVKRYEVDFNKAARSLTDALVPHAQRSAVLKRLLKDNVALIVVLESKFNQGTKNPGKHPVVCVANTHVNIHADLNDVKIWQVHTLLKSLEIIASSADMPMVLCGAFNAVPGSAPHALLSSGKVDPMHPELVMDPLGILRLANKLVHHLPLVSAYSSAAKIAADLGFEQLRRLINPETNEPMFTYYTRNFCATSDYIFYSADSLTVESLLEILDKDSLTQDTALPSPEWSSDHIALLAGFRFKPQTRRE